MRMRVCLGVVAAICIVAGMSCAKVVTDTSYNLTVVWQERKSVKDPIPLTTASVYAFFADPEKWEVTSIENARAGIISAVGNPENTRAYDMTTVGEGEDGNIFRFAFTKSPVMLVVADNNYPMYATGDANVVPNLPNMYVTLKFAPLDWKEGQEEPVVKKPWKFYGYGDVKIPIDTDLEIIPSVWKSGSGSSEILGQAKCYAFYGFDKANGGRVTSWEEARQGIAEKKRDDATGDGGDADYEKFDFDVQGQWNSDGLFMNLASDKVMLVVYNDVDPAGDDVKMYACCFLDLSDNPETSESRVMFDLRSQKEETTFEKWTVYYEWPQTEEPETPEDPVEPAPEQ